jgi:hypothetical protein
MEFSTEELKPLAEKLAYMIGSELEKPEGITASKIEADIRQCSRLMELTAALRSGQLLNQSELARLETTYLFLNDFPPIYQVILHES